VTSQKIATPIKKELKQLLLNMHNDPHGIQILEKLMIDRFEVVNDTIYNSIRKMQQFVNK